jgi:uncharacterized membrane protein YfbV (UPF0208 family)
MRVDRASDDDAYVDSYFEDNTPAPPVEPDYKALAAFYKNAFEKLTKQSLDQEAEIK